MDTWSTTSAGSSKEDYNTSSAALLSKWKLKIESKKKSSKKTEKITRRRAGSDVVSQCVKGKRLFGRIGALLFSK